MVNGVTEEMSGSPNTDKKPAGRIIAFVSAKGGTGKTVLSATTAYLLIKAGKKVVTIDSDFSTRSDTKSPVLIAAAAIRRPTPPIRSA